MSQLYSPRTVATKQLTTVNSTKQDYERRFHVTRALIGLPPSLGYAAWVVTIVPVKLHGCRCRRIRVQRRNGRRRNGRCRDVPVPRSPSAETVSAETVAPKRRRRNVLLRKSQGFMRPHYLVTGLWDRCNRQRILFLAFYSNQLISLA